MLAHLKISYRRPSLSFRCVDINSHYKSRHCATETCQKLFCKSIMTVLHSARSYVQPLLHLLLSCLCLWRQFYDLAITVASSSVSLLAFKVKIELFYYNGFRYKMAARPLLVLVWSPPEESRWKFLRPASSWFSLGRPKRASVEFCLKSLQRPRPPNPLTTM